MAHSKSGSLLHANGFACSSPACSRVFAGIVKYCPFCGGDQKILSSKFIGTGKEDYFQDSISVESAGKILSTNRNIGESSGRVASTLTAANQGTIEAPTRLPRRTLMLGGGDEALPSRPPPGGLAKKSIYAGLVIAPLAVAIILTGRDPSAKNQGLSTVHAVARDSTTTVVAGDNVAISVLDNDEGDGIYIAAIEQEPSVGVALASSDRQKITYWAPSEAAGKVSLRYRIMDKQGASATANVFIEVVKGSSPMPAPASAPPLPMLQKSERALRLEAQQRSTAGDFADAAHIYEKLGELYGHAADFWGAADFLNAAIPGTPESSWDCHQAISLYRRAAALGETKADERLRVLKQWADRTKSDAGKKGDMARICLRELS